MSKIGDLLSGAVIGTAIGALANAADSAVSALFMSGRSIGGLIPDVTLEEHMTDELTITDHPVEVGAAVSDHAFKRPSEVTMKVCWSDAVPLLNSIVGGTLFSGHISSANDLYDSLLKLQESRQPFDLVTGKRTYSDMLIQQLSVTTDKDTENALVVTVHMRQVILVQTTSTDLVPAQNQAAPQDTSALVTSGLKQAVTTAKQSALSSLFGSMVP